MLPRFFVPDLDPARAEAVLPPAEAHHLSRVLRLRAGDEVGIFDGRGRDFRGRVSSVGRDRVIVTLLEERAALPDPAVRLTLVPSLLKNDAMDEVVRDAAMIGVHTIQPVLSARTTVRIPEAGKAVLRWERIALASAKQCGRATLPRIHPPAPFRAWLDGGDRRGAFLLVEPAAAGRGAVRPRALAAGPVPAAATLIVGPEGGWTAEERDAAVDRGCVPLSIGGLTLRAESVPLAAVSALLGVWGA